MKGGVTYLDLEKWKDAQHALNRLEIWLRGEAIIHDSISDAAISTIRNVLAGRLPAPDSNSHRVDDLDSKGESR